MTDFAACFDDFRVSAFRLETLPCYTVESEADRIRAFRQGLPRPERSVRTSPWLARIAETTAAGKSWQRVRLVGWPLTEYQRYQMAGYRESEQAGEVIRIADRRADPALEALQADFWLFDAETSQPFAALMEYDAEGRYVGAQVTSDRAVIMSCKTARDLALPYSVPLDAYLADKEIEAA